MTKSSNKTSPQSTVDTLAVVLGDQLDPDYSTTLGLDKQDDAVVMMEVKGASTEPPSHVQRTVLFLAAMRHHAKRLADDGWRVRYQAITDAANTQSFRGELARAIAHLKPRRIACIEPGAFGVRGQIEAACREAGVVVQFAPDPHFLCSLAEFDDWAAGRKELVLEHFYRAERKRLGLLMTHDGKPEGGQWNYDKENRKSFKQAPEVPPVPRCKPDSITRQVIEDVRAVLPALPGELVGFGYPVTREQARQALEDFIDRRLPRFGDYQDAMWGGEHTLFHSVLSAPLNLKLLDPRELCEAAVEAYERGAAPLNAVEGFVRQIIGWREFIRGVYFHEGAAYAERNALEQFGDLPECYWSGETDMRCMREALGNVIHNAYGHHIERLMVTGNFALIAGVEPRQVNAWYLGMYTDAIEWVTTPNTVGMAMHADGGVVGTKPYAASGKYIDRMSNHCAACRYDPAQRSGKNACPFTVFYWDFLARNAKRFRSNRRMTMILKNLERIGRGEKAQITARANRLREALGIGEIRRQGDSG